MKKTFLLLATMILLVGCDAPQRTRAPSLYANSLNDPDNKNGEWTTTTTGGSDGSTTGSSTSGSNSGVTSTPGFEACNLGDKHQNIDVGWFGICQSTLDETSFKFRTSLASTSTRICLIPTYKDASGGSTYIGNPQCTYTQANTIVQGKLYKDRQNFTHLTLNGVTVMKENLVSEYVACMQGYINWPANACQKGHTSCSLANQCIYGGGNMPGTVCDNAARGYMAEVCNGFITKYGSAYSDLRMK